jgi:hypothetical protein
MVKETREVTNMTVRFAAALLGLASMFGASSPLWAKGRMLRIEISGGTLTSPLQITDERSLEEFRFWDGPGNNGMRLENAESGPIIDWKTGIAAQHPADLQRYEVSFYWMGCARDDPAPRDGKHPCVEVPVLAYVVFYEYDASSKLGFIYLPGRDDPGELEEIDSGTIWRGPGVAGHWVRATSSWADFVGPLIAKASHRSH